MFYFPATWGTLDDSDAKETPLGEASLSSVSSNTTTVPQVGYQVEPIAFGSSADISPAPFQNVPLLSSMEPTTKINNDPVLARGKIILGKWESLIEENRNDPNKITLPDEDIRNDRITIEGLLRANKDVPEPTRQEYLLLLDLFKLAQIRNFNNGLKLVESRYGDSITTQEKEGSFETKRIQKLDKYGRTESSKTAYGIKWYENQLEQLRNLLSYFNQEVLPKIGPTPPPLLAGLQETLREGAETLTQYKQFYDCMEDPSTDRCRGFIAVMASQSKKDGSPTSSGLRRDLDEEYDDMES